MRETLVRSQGREDPPGEWRPTPVVLPWTEEPGGLQSMGSQRGGHKAERLVQGKKAAGEFLELSPEAGVFTACPSAARRLPHRLVGSQPLEGARGDPGPPPSLPDLVLM